MKKKLLFRSCRQFGARVLLLGCAMLLCHLAGAQERLKNPGFESPLDPYDPTGLTGGKTNWTIVYVNGTQGDFAMHGRSTEASRTSGGHGAHLRPNTEYATHAYFTQTVTNLTAGDSYVLSGYMHKGFDNSNLSVYFEAIGGSDGATSVQSPEATTDRTQYFVTNTASPSGQIEVRLRLVKNKMTSDGPGLAKFIKSSAWFDDFSLTNAVPGRP